MPAQSQAQFRAMEAAAHGTSTLDIPKSVGQDFVAATPSPKGLPQRAPAHKPTSSVEAMTGLPSGRKKVRRGGGRHKAKQMSPAQHHQNLNAAMAKGDQQGAKLHALQLAKALHMQQQSQSQQPQQPQPVDGGPAELI